MGSDSAQFVAGVISRASKGSGGVAAVVSVGTLIFGATGVFVQLKAALNRVWGAQIKAEKTRDTLVRLIWGRVASFAMMLVIAFLLLVSLGAAGSMIVILLWVYYSSIIFLYGAEATQLSATALGWRIEPIEAAEQLDKERTREKVLAGRVPLDAPDK
jgi:uncharacterized BrkB/YihY/UPF0761 family membrane protein